MRASKKTISLRLHITVELPAFSRIGRTISLENPAISISKKERAVNINILNPRIKLSLQRITSRYFHHSLGPLIGQIMSQKTEN